MVNDNKTSTYNSLEDIRAYREVLSKKLDDNEEQIKDLWGSLFAKEDPPRHESSSQKVNRLLSTGIGLFDAAMLGWKIYRKFKKTSSLLHFRQRRQ